MGSRGVRWGGGVGVRGSLIVGLRVGLLGGREGGSEMCFGGGLDYLYLLCGRLARLGQEGGL